MEVNPSKVDTTWECPFPLAEYRGRWRRLQEAMATSGLDAILITAQTNFQYVTGYRTPAWAIRSRPLMAILRAHGDPVAVVSTTHAVELEAERVVRDLRAYEGFEEDAANRLVATIREEGLDRAKWGVEEGLEQRLGLPLQRWVDVCRALPEAQFEDGSAVLWQARMIKSEAEIVRLRAAGRIGGDAYASLLAQIRPGWTERRVYEEITTNIVRLGGEAPSYVTMTAGPGGYNRHNGWPRARAFEPGELFWMDLGATVQGYFCDYTRCAAIGWATPEQRHTYDLVLAMLDEALLTIRAGANAGAPVRAADAAARRAGARLRMASRIGHGLGLDMTEPPSLSLSEGSPLATGMVVAVEPGILTEHGWYHLEENVVVREDGYELLSTPMPRGLPVAEGR